jgi:hypothetical protein
VAWVEQVVSDLGGDWSDDGTRRMALMAVQRREVGGVPVD